MTSRLTLSILEQRAAESAHLRGHEMAPFTSFSETRAISACWRCGMEVMVNTKPLPNEIEIGGEAVALNCRKHVGN